MIIGSIDGFKEMLASAGPDMRIIVCGHKNPDGDCMGSILALTLALRGAGYDATPILSEPEYENSLYAFLPGHELFVRACDYEGNPDIAIGLDVPDPKRMGEAEELFNRGASKFGIDHHIDTKDYGDLVYSDSTAAAAGILVWDLIVMLGLETTADIANCLYVALMTDTGSFQYQNTDGRAFRYAAYFLDAGADPRYCATQLYQNKNLAALLLEQVVIEHMGLERDGTFAYSWIDDADLERTGAVRDDTEGLINVLRCIRGVEVALLMHARPEQMRCSLRSKTTADVSIIARELGGGGHKGASGFTSYMTVEETVAAVRAHLDEAFSAGAASE